MPLHDPPERQTMRTGGVWSRVRVSGPTRYLSPHGGISVRDLTSGYGRPPEVG